MKEPAPRNRTLTLTIAERTRYQAGLLRFSSPLSSADITDRILCGNALEVLDALPQAFADLLILDPPYNLTKKFGAQDFREMRLDEYEAWFEGWFSRLLPSLKPTASLYVCGDWRCSTALHRVLQRHVIVRNRITWEREKGRGAMSNWKNSSEDIWFCTVSSNYFFNVEAVKLKRRVIAPYRENGQPKDWQEVRDGGFRLTHPSNLWTDITVPFWSMPENTEHPTQKPEKLIAKLLLASSREGEMVFDPFLGSGTTAAVAQKLRRHFFGIEVDEDYACLAAKRTELAGQDNTIQGYNGGVFWERNTLAQQSRQRAATPCAQPVLLESPIQYKTRKDPR